jgi:N-acetylglucosamine-6-phosphate deacetylase
MTSADQRAEDEFSERLGLEGVSAFCPTTLSAPPAELREAVARLGRWVRRAESLRPSRAALPLGLHLEGPFISKDSCGAHPPKSIRKLSWNELETLWEKSLQTIRILTIAPEALGSGDLSRLRNWAKPKKIHLSIGHSQADFNEAKTAVSKGFRGVTHAWNAHPFHHREPGIIGAVLGDRNVFVELIADQVHVHPQVLHFTRKLHPLDRICWVSDCAPAAGLAKTCRFGPLLRVHVEKGACRTSEGHLAGGARLLPDAIARLSQWEFENLDIPIPRSLEDSLLSAFVSPIEALKLEPKLVKRLRTPRISWSWNSKGKISYDILN